MNIVIIQHIGDNGMYLFSVDESKQLKKGDVVVCETKRGEQYGRCCCGSFHVSNDALEVIMSRFCATTPLKPITGTFKIEKWYGESE